MINWPHVGLYGEFSNCEEGMIEAINRNFFIIDNVMQMKVIDFVENLPPSPSQGDVYIVEDSSYTYTAGGSYLMIYNGESWLQIIPKEGFLAYVDSLSGFYWFNGEDWLPLPMSIDDIKLKLARATSTGVLDGLVLSVNALDNSKFDIAPGLYEIVDNSDIDNPLVYTVAYPGSTGNTVTNLATNNVTYVSLDKDGLVYQSSSYATPNERRQYAFTGRLNHSNRTSISFADTFPDYKVSPVSSFYDLVDALAPFKMDDGLKVTPNGPNLSIDISGGSVFFRSDNYVIDKDNPHTKTYGSMTLAPLRKMTSTSTVDTSDVTVIEPNYYDVGGVRTLIPGGNSVTSIQRVYKYKSGDIRVQYGATLYNNISSAMESILTDEITVNDTVSQTAVLIAYIVVTKGCTDLTATADAKIVIANRFGGAGGAGGGGGGSGVITVANITARDAIASGSRIAGETIVYVTSESKTYQLVGGITNSDWQVLVTDKNVVTLTNKDIDGGTASNTSRLTTPKGTYSAIRALNRKEGTLLYNTDDKKLMVDGGTSLSPVPVFDNLDVFSQDIASDSSDSDWSFAKTGSGDSTFLITTSPVIGRAFKVNLNSLFGSESFSLRKTSDYAVPHTMRGQRVQMTYDYLSDVAQGGIAWEIVDQTNSVVIIPESAQQAKPAPSGVVTKGFIFFDIPLNCETLRVTLKRPTGAAATISKAFWFNNVELKKFSQNIGPVSTDPVSYTPTGSLTTNATYSGWWSREGAYLTLYVKVTFTGTNTQGPFNINLPNGLQIDTSLLDTTAFANEIGIEGIYRPTPDYKISAVTNGTNNSFRVVFYNTDTTLTARDRNPTKLNSLDTSVSAPKVVASGDIITVTIKVPIQGWSSTARYADYTLNQDVSFVGSNLKAITLPSGGTTTPIIVNSVIKDTTGSYNSTNGQYVVVSAGDFSVEGFIELPSISYNVANINVFALVYSSTNALKQSRFIGSNQTPVSYTGYKPISFVGTIPNLIAGDKIVIALANWHSSSISIPLNAPLTLSINKIATSQQLFAPIGPVGFNIVGTNGANITNTPSTIIFITKRYDSHGAFNLSTGEYTIPEDGVWEFGAVAGTISNVPTSDRILVDIVAAIDGYGGRLAGVGVSNETFPQSNTGPLLLKKGDIVKCRASTLSGTYSLSASVAANRFYGKKVN